MSRDVADFFDRNARSYRATSSGMAPYHRLTARRIEVGVAGDVLALGGVWAQASPAPGFRLTVADLSLAMLLGYRGSGVRLLRADGTALPLRPASFDHVVLPLVLHHVAGRGFAEAQNGARAVLGAVANALRPGGRVWISEFCPPAEIYALERWLAPVTRVLLGSVDEPLVVMHTAAFYRRALEDGGWADIDLERVRPPDVRALDWVRPIIALPALKVPRFLYPVRPTLITAARPAVSPADTD